MNRKLIIFIAIFIFYNLGYCCPDFRVNWVKSYSPIYNICINEREGIWSNTELNLDFCTFIKPDSVSTRVNMFYFDYNKDGVFRSVKPIFCNYYLRIVPDSHTIYATRNSNVIGTKALVCNVKFRGAFPDTCLFTIKAIPNSFKWNEFDISRNYLVWKQNRWTLLNHLLLKPEYEVIAIFRKKGDLFYFGAESGRNWIELIWDKANKYKPGKNDMINLIKKSRGSIAESTEINGRKYKSSKNPLLELFYELKRNYHYANIYLKDYNFTKLNPRLKNSLYSETEFRLDNVQYIDKTSSNEIIEIIFSNSSEKACQRKYYISNIVDFYTGPQQQTDTTSELQFSILNNDRFDIIQYNSLTYYYSSSKGNPQNFGCETERKLITGGIIIRPVQTIVASVHRFSDKDTLRVKIQDPGLKLLITAAIIREDGELTPMAPVTLPDGRKSLYIALPPWRATVPE